MNCDNFIDDLLLFQMSCIMRAKSRHWINTFRHFFISVIFVASDAHPAYMPINR